MKKIRKFSGNAVLDALKLMYLTEENEYFEYEKVEETTKKIHKGFILHLKVCEKVR